jgi:hypothetical protein
VSERALCCGGKRCWVLASAEQRLELNRASVAERRGGERKGIYCHVGVPTYVILMTTDKQYKK